MSEELLKSVKTMPEALRTVAFPRKKGQKGKKRGQKLTQRRLGEEYTGPGR